MAEVTLEIKDSWLGVKDSNQEEIELLKLLEQLSEDIQNGNVGIE